MIQRRRLIANTRPGHAYAEKGGRKALPEGRVEQLWRTRVAKTIPAAFTDFKTRLEITDLQAQTVSTRQNNVRDAVAAKLTVLDSFLTGSYSRNTMIAPLAQADIDIFVVLDPKYYEAAGQAALLDKVKRVLRETYQKTPEISRSGQAVTISFTDFKVDVVPSFNRAGGGYLIPTTYGNKWIETDPKRHVAISSQANATHNRDLVPLVKMLKSWNRTINGHFRSFHLEVLAWRIFNGVTISNFPSGTRHYFDKGRELITKQNPDPAGFGGDVGYYISTSQQVAEAVSRFSTAHSRALKAEEYARQGRIANVVDEWRKVFGDTFPSYG